MERHEIKEIIKEAIEESIVFSSHEADHEWIRTRINNEKTRGAMCQEITKSIIQWSVVGILGYAVIWIKEHYLP